MVHDSGKTVYGNRARTQLQSNNLICLYRQVDEDVRMQQVEAMWIQSMNGTCPRVLSLYSAGSDGCGKYQPTEYRYWFDIYSLEKIGIGMVINNRLKKSLKFKKKWTNKSLQKKWIVSTSKVTLYLLLIYLWKDLKSELLQKYRKIFIGNISWIKHVRSDMNSENEWMSALFLSFIFRTL